MRVLIGIVTYNRKKMLEKSLESLKIQTYKDFDVLVVNNNSTDDTKEFLDNYQKENKIIVKNMEINSGGAGGFSECVRYSIENNYDYIWLMDDDVVMLDNTIENMLEAAETLKNEFSFLSCTVKWTDNSLCVMNIPGTKNSQELYANRQYLKSNILPINYCSFVGCFLNIKHVKKFGLPIKEFFIYYDDTEYTERISKEKSGYWVLNSEVVHLMNANTDLTIWNLEDVGKIKRLSYDYRNRFYVAKRNGTKNAIKFLFAYFYLVLKLLFGKTKYKFKKMKYITKGIMQGLAFNPNIEYME